MIRALEQQLVVAQEELAALQDQHQEARLKPQQASQHSQTALGDQLQAVSHSPGTLLVDCTLLLGAWKRHSLVNISVRRSCRVLCLWTQCHES